MSTSLLIVYSISRLSIPIQFSPPSKQYPKNTRWNKWLKINRQCFDSDFTCDFPHSRPGQSIRSCSRPLLGCKFASLLYHHFSSQAKWILFIFRFCGFLTSFLHINLYLSNCSLKRFLSRHLHFLTLLSEAPALTLWYSFVNKRLNTLCKCKRIYCFSVHAAAKIGLLFLIKMEIIRCITVVYALSTIQLFWALK